MDVPPELRYSKEHEWVRVDGDVATVGITDYAQDQLGDIVYLDLPDSAEIVWLKSAGIAERPALTTSGPLAPPLCV